MAGQAESREWIKFPRVCLSRILPQAADPLPHPPLRVVKTGRNHLNEGFTPLLPSGIGERF
jgi:hypothetical protein